MRTRQNQRQYDYRTRKFRRDIVNARNEMEEAERQGNRTEYERLEGVLTNLENNFRIREDQERVRQENFERERLESERLERERQLEREMQLATLQGRTVAQSTLPYTPAVAAPPQEALSPDFHTKLKEIKHNLPTPEQKEADASILEYDERNAKIFELNSKEAAAKAKECAEHQEASKAAREEASILSENSHMLKQNKANQIYLDKKKFSRVLNLPKAPPAAVTVSDDSTEGVTKTATRSKPEGWEDSLVGSFEHVNDSDNELDKKPKAKTEEELKRLRSKGNGAKKVPGKYSQDSKDSLESGIEWEDSLVDSLVDSFEHVNDCFNDSDNELDKKPKAKTEEELKRLRSKGNEAKKVPGKYSQDSKGSLESGIEEVSTKLKYLEVEGYVADGSEIEEGTDIEEEKEAHKIKAHESSFDSSEGGHLAPKGEESEDEESEDEESEDEESEAAATMVAAIPVAIPVVIPVANAERMSDEESEVEEIVVLRSSSGRSFRVHSGIRDLIMEGNSSADTTTLEDEALDGIINFCNLYLSDRMNILPEPLKAPELSGVVQDVYCNFININVSAEDVLMWMKGAAYLNLEPLRDLCCAKVASEIMKNPKYSSYVLDQFSEQLSDLPYKADIMAKIKSFIKHGEDDSLHTS